jgi:DNA-binding winged helix-turn-helix (wHTH) protein/tetratricopeptide (TPR) repeat protein
MNREQFQVYEFEGFTLNVAEHTLRKGAKTIPLPPKVFDLLSVLVQNSGREMRKNEIMQLLWPESVVEESNLSQSIFLLRKSLDQGGTLNPLIVTIPGRGYRFTGKVRSSQAESRGPTTQTELEPVIRSIAVLPFHIINAANEEHSLSLVIADALISKLSNFPQITVQLTSAILKFLDPSQDPLAAGRELGVDAILNGTLQHNQGRIRVTAQLARVSDGYLFWADKFEGDFIDIFSVQESISEHIGNALAVKLKAKERAERAKRYTDNHLAYHAYVKGQFLSNRWTRQDITKAINYFTSAIDLDPQYALAYAGLSDAHYKRSELYDPPHEAMSQAKLAAQRALQLDDSLAEARTCLALTLGFYDWDWHAADREFVRAIELNPHYAPAHLRRGGLLAAVGRFDESIAEMKGSQMLDPLGPVVNAEIGRVFYLARRFDLAISQLQETLELEPNFWYAQMFLGWAYEQQGHYAEATAILHHASTLDKNVRTMASLGHVYAVSGKKSEAKKILRLLSEHAKEHYVSPYEVAGIYAGLGELDHAYTLFEKACDDRSKWVVWLNVDPKFDNVRADSRFHNITHRVLGSYRGLPGTPLRVSDSRPS